MSHRQYLVLFCGWLSFASFANLCLGGEIVECGAGQCSASGECHIFPLVGIPPTYFQNSFSSFVGGTKFGEERASKVVLFRVRCGRLNPVGHSGVSRVNGRFASD